MFGTSPAVAVQGERQKIQKISSSDTRADDNPGDDGRNQDNYQRRQYADQQRVVYALQGVGQFQDLPVVVQAKVGKLGKGRNLVELDE